MIHHLRVANLGVLEDASIEPGPGFTVITGETGAGKTMLLGALRLLTGEKAKTSAVGPFGEEALAEGLFSGEDGEVGVTRVVPRKAKSRAYLDGALAASGKLEERIGGLVEIVGQHDRLLLQKSQTVLALVDSTLTGPGLQARSRYADAWSRYQAAVQDQLRLGGDRTGLERDLDLLRYQANEIEGAGLIAGDDLRFESMAARLKNAEAVRENLTAATDELERLAESSGEVVAKLRKLAMIDPGMADPVKSAESLDVVAHDLLRDLRGLSDTAFEDPAALETVEQRLTALGELKRKYGRTLDDVLEFGADASRRAFELERLIEKAGKIDDLLQSSGAELARIGADLSAARREIAQTIEEETRLHLGALGLTAASVSITMESAKPGSTGADKLEILFASDDRLDSGRIQEVASGGELSRLMLALRLATRAKEAGTMVFDEIDAGVGGATALALGRKLGELAQTCQVLCVTHLPQVAAYAEDHFVIERDGTRARVRQVDGQDRLTELSRMLAGLPESERGREAAAELLEDARSR
ncbi:MAG: AAA family ATPase [Acidimicrobiia bacterium]